MKEKYDLLEEITEDTFWKLYKAKVKNTGELRAIKILDKLTMIDFGDNFYQDILLKSFYNMTICGLNNINSVKLYEYYITETEIVIVTELIDETLGQFLIKRNQGLNPEEILGILTQLNNTFKIMANKLIVHRDLKLDNIFIKYKNIENTEFTIKLSNYEVSTRLESNNQKMDLRTGTKLFMAPEILKSEIYVRKCDLWSLGVIIYLCLFIEFPIREEDHDLIIKEPLKTSGNALLDDLIRKLLVKNPDNRITWEQYFEHPFFQ